MIPLPAHLTPFPKIPLTNEESTGAINEAHIGASKGARNPPSYLFIS